MIILSTYRVNVHISTWYNLLDGNGRFYTRNWIYEHLKKRSNSYVKC